MSAHYQSIGWNKNKKLYDGVIFSLINSYLIIFCSVAAFSYPEITQETIIIRSTGSLALLLLHIILAIGPLARLNSLFLPLLYNRRHLGVSMFCVAAMHGIFSILQFHSMGNINPILSVFISNTHYTSLTRFPFEAFGFVSLVILGLMAVTSHDFWLHNLGPWFWKSLHMMVYLAYGMLIMHVVLGVLQFETSPILISILSIGFITLSTLHLLVGSRELKVDEEEEPLTLEDFTFVCNVQDIPENRAKIVCLGNERIAIFKYDNKISAVSNVCKHQNGPLGEGKIIDGCITCPWHGYQYQPHNGSSPPPFKEKVATYDLKLLGDEVWVNPQPYPEGTERPPIILS